MIPTDGQSVPNYNKLTEVKRIVKDYEERRLEFINATQEFFYSIGYDRMSIQLLTEKVGVAKGTFYHYFKSKEDLLSQWVFHIMRQNIEQNERIINDTGLDAISKLNKIFRIGRDWKLDNIELIISLIKILNDDHNIRLRTEMARQSAQMSKSIFATVIEQGVNEGVLEPAFPADFSHILPRIGQLFSDEFSAMMLSHSRTTTLTEERAHNLVSIWQEIIERILGAPKGSLLFVDAHFISEVIHYLNQTKFKETSK